MSEAAEFVVAKQETEIQPVRELADMTLIDLAVEKGATVEQIEKLWKLHLEVEANKARKAFHAAFAEFKSEAIKIQRSRMYTDGPLKGKKYAELHSIIDAITPALSRHGLSLSWKLTVDKPEWMEETCTLTHVLGHSESSSMGSPPDTGPGRNTVQARGSTDTYLKKYTAKSVCGLAEEGDDNDGQGAQRFDKLQEYLDSISTAPNLTFLRNEQVRAVKEAMALKNASAINAINEATAKRKDELLKEHGQ